MKTQSALFDSAANSYDADFTYSAIGMFQRERVHHWLEECKLLNRITKIFEVNCGTGLDAEYLLKNRHSVVATDASAEMIKVAKESRNSKINFYQRKFSDISIDDNVGEADFVFSNFGGLNCLSEVDLTLFFNDLAQKQKKGASLAVVIMPKFCVTEDVYLLLKGKFSQILRRSKNEFLEVCVAGEKVRTYYHSPKMVKKLLQSKYNIKLVKPIAHFLPPSYLEPFFQKNKWLLLYLNFMERTFGRLGFLAANADHFILIAQRK